MVNKVKSKGKATRQTRPAAGRGTSNAAPSGKKALTGTRAAGSVAAGGRSGKAGKNAYQARRRDSLRRMLMDKRQEIMNAIRGNLGQSVTEDYQRRLEGMDSGDQALMDLERELGISLSEMRNRRRQLIDEALIRLEDGSYGLCADCGIEISEKRLAAVPFAKLCVECQSREELLEKIEKEEDRD